MSLNPEPDEGSKERRDARLLFNPFILSEGTKDNEFLFNPFILSEVEGTKGRGKP